MLASRSGTRPGFTLFEILMVCVLMGVLFSISFQSFSNAKDRSANSQVDGNIRLIQQALTTYEADNEKFPHALTRVTAGAMGTPNPNDSVLLDPLLDRRYLPGNQMPKTPFGQSWQSNNIAPPRMEVAACLYRVTSPELVDPVKVVRVPPNPTPVNAAGKLPAQGAGPAPYTTATFGATFYETNGPTTRNRYVLFGVGKARRAARVVAFSTNAN